MKKLKIKKETLMPLDVRELVGVAGGTATAFYHQPLNSLFVHR